MQTQDTAFGSTRPTGLDLREQALQESETRIELVPVGAHALHMCGSISFALLLG